MSRVKYLWQWQNEQGVHKALQGKSKKPTSMADEILEEMDEKTVSAICLNLFNLQC